MANKTLQLLRNATLYADHEAALTGLQAKLASASDGEPVLARYTDENDKERTLLGIKSSGGYEIFDNQGGNDAIEDAIEALIGNASEGYDTLGEIETVIKALDASSVADDNKVVTDVTQADGQITATASNITGVKLGGYSVAATAADVAAGDTLGEALGKLQKYIDDMQKSASVVNGQVVTTVSEADGVVSETKANVKDLQLGGYSKDTSATGDIASTDTINAALSKLENKTAAITVASADNTVTIDTTGGNTDLSVNIDGTTIVKANDGTLSADLTLTQLTTAEVTALGDSNVKDAYKVIYATDSNRNAIGDTIKIYKDSSLYRAYLGHVNDTIAGDPPVVTPGTGSEALCFIYQKADGTYELVAVNVESFLQESEFKDGLQVVNNEVSVKLDTTGDDTGSGKFLTVSANGLKLDGVSDAITAAIEALDVTTDAAVAGQYVAAIEETDGVVAVKTRANVSEAVLNNYSKGSTGTAVAATDTVNEAISKLENQIANATAASATVVAEGTDAGNNMSIVATTDQTDGHKTYTINLTDVASDAALTAEIAARKAVDGQNGDTYAANSNANYIASATSLNGADVALDTALKTVDDTMLTSIAAGNGIYVSSKASKSQTITAVAVTNDPIIEVTANGIGTKETATFDCGSY